MRTYSAPVLTDSGDVMAFTGLFGNDGGHDVLSGESKDIAEASGDGSISGLRPRGQELASPEPIHARGLARISNLHSARGGGVGSPRKDHP